MRLQLGPDGFPEALEASPCLSAHRGGRRVHPTVSGPDLSWHEKNPFFSYVLTQLKNLSHKRCRANLNTTQPGGHFSRKPVHSCRICFNRFLCFSVLHTITELIYAGWCFEVDISGLKTVSHVSNIVLGQQKDECPIRTSEHYTQTDWGKA